MPQIRKRRGKIIIKKTGNNLRKYFSNISDYGITSVIMACDLLIKNDAQNYNILLELQNSIKIANRLFEKPVQVT